MDVSAAAVLCSRHPSACCRMVSELCVVAAQGAGGRHVLHRGEGLRRLCGDVLCDPHRAGGCMRRRRLDTHRLLGYHLIQSARRGGRRAPAAHVRSHTASHTAGPRCCCRGGGLTVWLSLCGRRCDWVISCPDPETHVHLTFDEFNISPEQATTPPALVPKPIA